MTLPTLKPRVQMLQHQVRSLTTENTNPRPRGRAWMDTRERMQVRHGSRCAHCGRLWMPEIDQVDHRIPREHGGSDGDENLQLLCDDCHEVKTKQEASGRAQRSVSVTGTCDGRSARPARPWRGGGG